VENQQARKSLGLPDPIGRLHSANVSQICSVLEFLSSTWQGGVDLTDGCYLLGWVTTLRLSAYHRLRSPWCPPYDHAPCHESGVCVWDPEVPAGELEGDRPLEPKTGTHNVRWVSQVHCGVPLSCPATGRPHGTLPRPRLKTTTCGMPRGLSGTPAEVNTSLHLTPNPNSVPVTCDWYSPTWPAHVRTWLIAD
jgi:hypothetical protein